VEGLRDSGVHTDVWAFNGDQRSSDQKVDTGETRYLRGSRTLLGLNRLVYAELLRRKPDVDIIHVYNTQQLPAAVHYSRKHRTKVTATLNNLAPICTNPSEYVEGECADCRPWDSLACVLRRPGPLAMRAFMPVHWLESLLLHRLSRRAEGYIALSEATRKCYLDAGYSAERIKLIPNMFDPGLSAPTVSPRDGRDKIVLYVGRLEVEKGVQVLIKAFALLDGDKKMYIVGKGDYEVQLKQLVREMDLEDRVTFTGFIDQNEIDGYYDLADVFVHPALWPEPFPRTILEAIAHRLPLLVSSSGSSASIIGPAGLSFKTGDEKDLADKLGALLADEDLRNRMAIAGEGVLQRYHPDTVMSQVLEFYGSLLS
jgi:starch synthase